MSKADQIVSIIRTKGPVLPAQIAKLIETDILIASAHMSDLVSRKMLMLSSAKIGGSPVYYLKGQEPRLEQTLYPHLNGKDKQTLDMLKQRKIVKDENLEPLTRVSLKKLKDFAEPINVTHNGNTVLFWKWKTLDEKIIQETINNMLTPKKPVQEERPALKPEPQSVQEVKPATKPIEKREEQRQLEPKKIEKRTIKPDDFFAQVEEYFKRSRIEIINFDVIRKNAEIDYVLKIPSSLGKLMYYCKAKNKKRITDSDLSAAFIQGQLKKLPAIIIMTGELNKKAEELCKTEEFKGLLIKKM